LSAELARHKKARPATDTTFVLSERASPRETYLFIKGDFTRRGPDVAPGTPAFLPAFRAGPPGAEVRLARTRPPFDRTVSIWRGGSWTRRIP